MARPPFTFAGIPESSTLVTLIRFVLQNFGKLRDAAPQGPSHRTLTIATTLTNGIHDEYAVLRCDATVAPFTVTLPNAASSGDTVLTVKKIDASANAVTIAGQGTDTIEGSATKSLATRWKSYTLQAREGGWDILAST